MTHSSGQEGPHTGLTPADRPSLGRERRHLVLSRIGRDSAPTMKRSSSSAASGFEHVPAALLPSDPNMYWQLTGEEERLITQLTEAYRTTHCGQSYVNLCKCSLWGDQALAVVSEMTSDMVTFFTKVPDFRNMPPKDQAAVLSAGAMPIFLLSNAFAAPRDVDDVGVADGPATQHERLVQRLCGFQRSLRPILRDDLPTAVLLLCAVLFDSRAPDLFNRQDVNGLQDKYMILMKHYVESQCSYLFSWHYVEAMMVLVEEAKALAALVTGQFPGWKAIIEPLIHKLNKPDCARDNL